MVKDAQTEGAKGEMLIPSVIGIEHIDDLAKSSLTNLNKSYAEQMNSGVIQITCGDGRKGLPSGAPYDAIHAGCGCSDS